MSKVNVKKKGPKVLVVCKDNMSKTGVLRVIIEDIEIDENRCLPNFFDFPFFFCNYLIECIFFYLMYPQTDNEKSLDWAGTLFWQIGDTISFNDEIAASFEVDGLIIKKNQESLISKHIYFSVYILLLFSVLNIFFFVKLVLVSL